MRRFALLLALPLTVTFTASLALSHTGVENPRVMARMMGMSDMAREFAVLVRMARRETAFDADAVEAALQQLSTHGDAVPGLFEENATDPRSEARPLIWEEFDEFTAQAEAVSTAIDNLPGPITTLDDIAPALAVIGQTCQSCHDRYRIEN